MFEKKTCTRQIPRDTRPSTADSERLQVAKLLEEGKYSDQKVSGSLLLGIVKVFQARKQALDVQEGGPEDKLPSERMTREKRGPLHGLIDTYDDL